MGRPNRNLGQALQPPANPPWQPFDISKYDRTASLNAEESVALEQLAAAPLSYILPATELDNASLTRLLAPLSDSLSITTGKSRSYEAYYNRWAMRLILHDVWARRAAFWSWTEEDWLATIQSSLELSNPPTNRLVVCAYVLTGFSAYHGLKSSSPRALVNRIFGAQIVAQEIDRLGTALTSSGYSAHTATWAGIALRHIMLRQRSPCLEAVTDAVLESVRQDDKISFMTRRCVYAISFGLVVLGLRAEPIVKKTRPSWEDEAHLDIHPEWLEWCQRWRNHSTLERRTINGVYTRLLRAGRWLKATRPDVTSPTQWDRALCAAYVKDVVSGKVGDWIGTDRCMQKQRIGEPLTPRAKNVLLAYLRIFFNNLQEWGFIPVRFSPNKALETPSTIKRLITPDPRDIDDSVWLKLVWASLNLTEDDINYNSTGGAIYPLEMVSALAVLWTHAGLRSDELVRLPVGAIRPQSDAIVDQETGHIAFPTGTVCYLEVPAGKKRGKYQKPVAPVVLRFVREWEALRPRQPAVVDRKTGEKVHFLFMRRGSQLHRDYINESMIPALIRKAGVPETDVKGAITSHRGRASMATMLANSLEGMSIIELMEWLGHTTPQTTMSYVRVREATLARSFARADRSARMIRVLIDQEAARSGAVAAGEPLKYYDLGNSYCTYDFWSSCKHRMVCPGCAWNVPKNSARGQAIEAKQFLLRVLEEVPLTNEEREMVEGGIEIHQLVIDRLAHTPTPDGRTPLELGVEPHAVELVQLSYERYHTAEADG